MQSSSTTMYGNSSTSSYLFASPPSPSGGGASASSSLRNSASRSPNAYYNATLPPEPVLSATRSPQLAASDPYHHRQYALKPVRSKADLQPQIHPQPKYRRLDEDGKFLSPLHLLTAHLTETYRQCNPGFSYKPAQNPRRVLTKPSKGVKNDGYDNEDGDYILCVNDVLGNDERHRYRILDMLGSGTFGQVVKCQNLKTNDFVAVKVVKNKPAYHNQSLMEVAILELLNGRYDPSDEHHILRLLDHFTFRSHLCLVFELMSVNLYELIKQNQFRGLSTNLVRVFTAQMLDSLTVLNEAKIIHCDLKPENVLLKNLESPTIKIIDFGSACHEHKTIYTYIQSRFYRSPEVLLGLPYSSAIDMWSLGCIAAELFLGLPLFPGSSEYNQISRIVEMLGYPPSKLIEFGKTASNFFNRIPSETGGRPKFIMKTLDEYSRENNAQEKPSKRYFNATTLPDIVQNYPVTRKGLSTKEIDKEKHSRLAFIDFLHGLLNLNPFERWSPQQAKLHPFITGEKFTGKFQPPMLFTGRSSRASTSSVTSGTTSLATGGGASDVPSHLSPAQAPSLMPPTTTPRQRSSTISGGKVAMNLPPKVQQLSAVNEMYEAEKQAERKPFRRDESSNGVLHEDPNNPVGKPMLPSASLPAAFNEHVQLPYTMDGSTTTTRVVRPTPSPRHDAPPVPPLPPNSLGVVSKRAGSKSPRDRSSYLPDMRQNVSPSGRPRPIPESEEEKIRMIREENRRFAEKLAAEAVAPPLPPTEALAPPSTPQRSSVASYMRQSLSRRSSQAQDGPPEAQEEPSEERQGVLSNLMKRSSAILGGKKRQPQPQQQQPGTAMMKTVSTSAYDMSSNHSTPPVDDGYGQQEEQPFLTVTSKKGSRKSATFQQVQQAQQAQQQANQGMFKRRGSYDVTNMGGKTFEAYQQQKAMGQTSQGTYRRRGSYDMSAGMGYDPNASPRQGERRINRGSGDGNNLQLPTSTPTTNNNNNNKSTRRQTYQPGEGQPRHKVPPPLKIPNPNDVPQGHFLHSSTLPPSTPNELPMSPTVYTRPAAPAPPGSSAAQHAQAQQNAAYGSRAYKTRSQSMSASNKDMYAMTAATVQSSTNNYPLPGSSGNGGRYQDRRTSMRPAPKPELVNYNRGFSFEEFPPLPATNASGAGAGRWRRPSNQTANTTQDDDGDKRGLKEWVDEQSQRTRQQQDY